MYNVKAGAWVQEKGSYYYQFSFTYLKYDQLLLGSDKGLIGSDVSDLTFQSYLEYGLTERLTLINVLPFKHVNSRKLDYSMVKLESPLLGEELESGQVSGIGNMSIGFKWKIKDEGHVLSWQTKLNSKGLNREFEKGLQTGYDAWGITNSILHGKGLKKGYYSEELGVKWQSNNYSSYFIYSIEYGRNKEWSKGETWMIFVLDAFLPLNKASNTTSSYHMTGLFPNGQSWVSPGVKLIHNFNEHVAINFAAYGAFYSNYGGAFPTLNIGLSIK